jgi:hypothetical protein
MALDEDVADQADDAAPPRRRRVRFRYVAAAVLLVLAVAFAWVWVSRERLAENIIADQLAQLGLPATYEIVQIGPRRQIIANIVVGDPGNPDLTVERAEVTIVPKWGFPGIGTVTLVRPRLYGSYRGGVLSFGSLDKVLFAPSEPEQPFSLPDFKLRLVDGRARLDSDYGPIGIKADGRGNLQNGFAGILAANAPAFEGFGCTGNAVTLYGKVTIKGERPSFSGPARIAALACPDTGLTLADAGLQIDARLDKALDGAEGEAGLRTGPLAYGSNRVIGTNGEGDFTWRDGRLTSSYSLVARQIETSAAAFAVMTSEGRVRTADGFARLELEGDLEGNGLRIGSSLDQALSATQASGADTLIAPLLGKLRAGLKREQRASSLAGSFTVRKAGEVMTAVVPQAALRGGSGETLVALSRFQLSTAATGVPRLSGNFSTGGADLPRIAGRMERQTGGGVLLRMSMAEYRAGDASVALPELVLVQGRGGALGFSGRARLSGALPGGFAQDLELPLSGNYSGNGGLALWPGCTDLRFTSLAFANVTLERRGLTLCPPPGTAIVRVDGRGTRIAAGTPSLDLRGRLGETPIALRSGPVGFAWPGSLSAKQVDVALGPEGTATRFRLNDLSAQLGDEIAGTFEGADVLLYAVPLDVLQASGSWRYAGGQLTLTDGAFRIEDREQVDRFAPLVTRDATLSLVDNVIAAEALLREPKSDREVTVATIRHDLGTGRGRADLAVRSLLFDAGLQPDTLTPLALGVVANVNGTVTGNGRIEWNEAGVTSTGSFSSEALDFAAAFGPVKGASGTVVFTDLLGLTTAPGQVLTVKSVNPGIEVNDGSVRFRLVNGALLAVEGGSWPFMGGTLTLRPLDFNIGATEARRFVLEIEGLQAALFLQKMELANISASGVFDGTMPLVFDENGGRIEGGLLLSREPGGNLSYVGDLTYKDLSAMANFAFDALKSMDYTQMRIAMDGDLTGEIVTRVRFDGVKQGEGAKRNFITERLANLPIRFNINIRAPFYKLISTFKAMYDPAYIRDPRELGLLDAQGNVIKRESDGEIAPIKPEDLVPDEAPIQPLDSEARP